MTEAMIVKTAAVKPPSLVSPIPRSISRCLMPATKWKDKADKRPQVIKLPKPVVMDFFAAAKPSADSKELLKVQIRKMIPTNKITPATRCVIEVNAGSGKLNLVRSRFIGRC